MPATPLTAPTATHSLASALAGLLIATSSMAQTVIGFSDPVAVPPPQGTTAAWLARLELNGVPTEPGAAGRAGEAAVLDLGATLGAHAPLAATIDAIVLHADVGSGMPGLAWRGRVLDGSQASFVLSRVGDAVAGAVWHPHLGTLNIVPTAERDASGQRLSLVMRLDPDSPWDCGTEALRGMGRDSHHVRGGGAADRARRTPAAKMVAVPPYSCDCGDDGSQVDVLIVYTAPARNQAGGTAGIEAVALASVESINLALANSAVTGLQIHLAAATLTSYDESLNGAHPAEVYALARRDDGFMDDVHPLRETHRADLVAMLRSTEDAVNGGIAFVGPGAPEYGFSISLWNIAVGGLVFAHELGHNFGLAHDRLNSGATFCHHAFGTTFSAGGQTYGTIMSYPGTKVPHYSNPDVAYLGTPTGVPLGAGLPCHCALGIERTRVAVANQVPSGESFADCNGNGQPDCDDIDGGASVDDNANGVPDECELRVYVNASAAEGGDGRSWATAFRTLSEAIGEPRFRCGEVVEVWVAAGTYAPVRPGADAGRQDAFWLAPHMRLLGGFAGGETSAIQRDPVGNPTILSGDRLGDDAPAWVNRLDNAYRVVGVAAGTGPTALIDGFTIRGGTGNIFYNGGSNFGGGILGMYGMGALRDCVITDNYAERGGGLAVGNAEVSIVNCLIAGNRCYKSGDLGGLGGGLLIQHEAAVSLLNCTVAHNETIGFKSAGGGMDVRHGSTVEVVNSLLWGNTGSYGPQVAVHYEWPLTSGEQPSTLTVSHSTVQGGQAAINVQAGGIVNWGVGNLTIDPKFVSPGSGNWRLLPGSPAVDAGDNAVLPTESSIDWALDLDGHLRLIDGNADGAAVVDMGAYERQATGCGLGDLDCDGDVGASDLGVLLALWGTDGPEGDLNADGAVDGADLGLLLGKWQSE